MLRIRNVIRRIWSFSWRALLVSFALATVILIVFNIPVGSRNDQAELGVTFSVRYAREIGLDAGQVLGAALDDLGIRKLRIPVYWDATEKASGEFDFSDTDWQLGMAKERGAEVILVVGQKVPRWPECFIPDYLKDDDSKRKSELLEFVRRTVEHYRDHPEIRYWQVENEPFLKFGVCPDIDPDLLDREIAAVREADPTRKIIVTDSGELSLWINAAKRADIFGTTMYRTIYSDRFGYYEYPIGPRFFRFKYWLIGLLANQKNAIVAELQAEPWIKGWTTNAPIEEQYESMNPEKLRANVEYAEEVGFPEIYLWGAEWWYWMREHGHPEVWETARELFRK